MKSEFTQEIPTGPFRRALTEWFTSFFGIVTTILILNVVAAHWYDDSIEWLIVAWALLGGHVITYVLMCFVFMAIVGGAVGVMSARGKGRR
jgi:hypothetical protein